MNGQTAKLLRKTSGGDRDRYKMVKKAYTASPQHIRAQGKQMARELSQVLQAEAQITKMQKAQS